MTGNFHPSEPDDRDDSSDDHWLSTLLSALAALDSDDKTGRRTTGRRQNNRSVIDYDISMRSIDDLEEGGRDTGASPGKRGPHSGRSPAHSGVDSSDSSRSRTRRTTTSDHRVTKREYDDELLVTADINGIEPDDVTVGFDESMLVIGVSGQELERIEIPWADGQRTSNATIKNGVLTVQIEPISGDDGATGAETRRRRTTMSDLEIDDLDSVLEDGEEALTTLETALGDVDSLDELEDSALEDVVGDVETLATLASSMETVLETIDLTEVPDAIEADELLEALEVGEIPAALADEDTGATDVVDFTQVFRAIDLLNAWDATDLGDLWRRNAISRMQSTTSAMARTDWSVRPSRRSRTTTVTASCSMTWGTETSSTMRT